MSHGDNKPDIIVANAYSNNIGVFLSIGEIGKYAEYANEFAEIFICSTLFRNLLVNWLLRTA